ncbi:MAG TPA: hypothetical protein GX724_00015 [Fibrobacter sp.]|nr:hypothetical protein [Fibrobacter sp.]
MSIKKKWDSGLAKLKGLSSAQKVFILFVAVLLPAGILVSTLLILYFKGKNKG